MKVIHQLLLLSLAFCLPFSAFAEETFSNHKIKLKWDIEQMDLDFGEIDGLVGNYQKYYYKGLPVKMPVSDSCSLETQVTDVLETREQVGINRAALRDYLISNLAPKMNEEKKDVTIQASSGNVIFSDNGRNGRELEIEKAVYILKKALEEKSATIELPLSEIPATLTVNNQELFDKGIREVVATGVSDFSRSPYNRVHNIKTGLKQFNGVMIESGSIFSFGEQLGEVTGRTGYLQELVIKGDKTVPDYGGGLCQVTSTGFRAVLLGGFPIVERKNHSYAVSYYNPPGTDAAIYFPSVDLKFVNDSDTPLLMQTYIEGEKAYFTLYGTKDQRDVKLFGPYISNWRAVPESRTEFTDTLAPGQKKKVGDAHSGYDAYWHRLVRNSEGLNMIEETIFSRYEARPLYYLVGGAAEVVDAGI